MPTTPTPQRIPPELRNLCARLATERTRPATWTLAAELRRQMLERLKRGEDAGALVTELRAAIGMRYSAGSRSMPDCLAQSRLKSAADRDTPAAPDAATAELGTTAAKLFLAR